MDKSLNVDKKLANVSFSALNYEVPKLAAHHPHTA